MNVNVCGTTFIQLSAGWLKDTEALSVMLASQCWDKLFLHSYDLFSLISNINPSVVGEDVDYWRLGFKPQHRPFFSIVSAKKSLVTRKSAR